MSPLRKRLLFRLAAPLLGCVTLLGACYALRAPLLTALANTWVVNDPATNADAIVVLGGSVDLRPFEAARLYHQGLAPKILYMDVKLTPVSELGLVPSEEQLTRSILLSNNVPETALQPIGHAVASTFDESRALRAWAQKTGAKSILIPTDLSHTRRVRWIFRKELKGTGVQIHVRAIQPREYGLTNWWKCEQGLISFQNECVKLAYYWLKY